MGKRSDLYGAESPTAPTFACRGGSLSATHASTLTSAPAHCPSVGSAGCRGDSRPNPSPAPEMESEGLSGSYHGSLGVLQAQGVLPPLSAAASPHLPHPRRGGPCPVVEARTERAVLKREGCVGRGRGLVRQHPPTPFDLLSRVPDGGAVDVLSPARHPSVVGCGGESRRSPWVNVELRSRSKTAENQMGRRRGQIRRRAGVRDGRRGHLRLHKPGHVWQRMLRVRHGGPHLRDDSLETGGGRVGALTQGGS